MVIMGMRYSGGKKGHHIHTALVIVILAFFIDKSKVCWIIFLEYHTGWKGRA